MLSYSREDGVTVCDYFEQCLREAEFWVWRDLNDVPGGADWRAAARETIRTVDVVLVFLTPAAVISESVRWEWETALSLSKRVVPLLISDCRIPPELSGNRRDLRKGYQQEPTRVIGDCEREWQRIESRIHSVSEHLDDVLQGSSYRDWIRAGEKSVEAKLRCMPPALPPEVFETVLDVLNTLGIEAAGLGPLPELLDSILAGTFEVPARPTVLTAHAETVRRIFKPLRDRIPGIRVPVVLMVMNQQEARSLDDETAFAEYPIELRTEFQAYRKFLPQGWTTRYGVTPENSCLFPGQPSLGVAIHATLADQCSEALIPQFINIRDLAQPKQRTQLWQLRNNPCVLIIDATSTRHPLLQRCFRRTCLDSCAKTLVVRIKPETDGCAVQLTGLLVQEWFASEFESRVEEDASCADVADWGAFRRWVRAEVPRSIPNCRRGPGNLWSVINQVG